MFQDIGASALARQRSEAQTRAPADEAAELIDRYPNLSEVELTRLIHVYSQLSALDLALMISDEKRGRKLDRFFEEHRSRIKTPFRQYAVLVAIAAVGLLVVIWSMMVTS